MVRSIFEVPPLADWGGRSLRLFSTYSTLEVVVLQGKRSGGNVDHRSSYISWPSVTAMLSLVNGAEGKADGLRCVAMVFYG